jgi:death on curing protein
MTTQPWSRWIDTERIFKLHSEGIRRYSGLPSSPVPGCIESALGAAYNAEMYSMPEVDEETAITGLTFCGYLLFYIASKQCWSDGSKRAAWASAMWVLASMQLTVDASDDDAYRLCMDIAEKRIVNGEQVVIWIADRLKELSN